MHCSNNWQLLQVMWNSLCQQWSRMSRQALCLVSVFCELGEAPVAQPLLWYWIRVSVTEWWQHFIYVSDLKQSQRRDKRGRRRFNFHPALICALFQLWWSWRRRFCRCRRGTGSETCCSGTGRRTTGRATSTLQLMFTYVLYQWHTLPVEITAYEHCTRNYSRIMGIVAY